MNQINHSGAAEGGKGGGGGVRLPQAAPLQGRQFLAERYFYYTNRGGCSYIFGPGRQYPQLCHWLSIQFMFYILVTFTLLLLHYIYIYAMQFYILVCFTNETLFI